MYTQQRDWIKLVASGDFTSLWMRLHEIVSRHVAVKNCDTRQRSGSAQLLDSAADLTQEVFLKLLEKDRWQHYLREGYDAANVEHELVHVEIPNLIGQMLRQRCPESFRLARRISTILQHDDQFQLIPLIVDGNETVQRASRKQLYGLRGWPLNKRRKDESTLVDLVREVPCRARDTRRSGRSSSSQVIISNNELTRLMIDILKAVDAPVEVRTLRQLVLSKLTLTDVRVTSLSNTIPGEEESANPTPAFQIVDTRPTPEQVLLNKEEQHEIELVAHKLIESLRAAVNFKPRRWERLIRVVYHCYFDDRSLSQCNIARMLDISNALVTHYRLLFDQAVKSLNMPFEKWQILNDTLRLRLLSLMTELDTPADLPAPTRSRPATTPVVERPRYAAAVLQGDDCYNPATPARPQRQYALEVEAARIMSAA